MRFLYYYKKSFEELSQSLQNYEYKRNDNLVYSEKVNISAVLKHLKFYCYAA